MPFGITGYIVVAFVVVAGLLGVYAWDADKALKREHDAAQAAIMQRDQLQRSVIALQDAIAERNRTLAQMGALPEVRKRLCAQRSPTDGCCQPEPAVCTP